MSENDNIVVSNFTSAKITELHFERRKLTKSVSINQIIHEWALYDKVDITTLVFNLEEPVTVMKDGKDLRLWKNMIKDSTDKMTVVIFELLIEKVRDGSCYDFTNMIVERYLDEWVLKTTLTTWILKSQIIGFTKSDDDVIVCAKDTKVVGKMVSVEFE